MKRIFLVFLLYLPFQVALNPFSGIDLASIRVFILFLFFFWLSDGLKKRKILIKNSWQTGLIVTFLFLNLFSVIKATNIDWSLRKLLFLFSIFPIYFVVGQVVKSRKVFLLAVEKIVLSGLVMAMIGIVQFFSQFIFGVSAVFNFWAKSVIFIFLGSSFGSAVVENPSWLVNIAGKTYLRATAIFPDPHMFSFYLGLIFPLSLGMIFETNKKNLFFVITVVTIFLADILTFSRGGYLGLFAGIVLAVIFLWDKINKKYRMITGFILFLSLGFFLISSPVAQRFSSSFNLKEGSNQGRLAMWEKARSAIKDNPFLGVGIGNYPLEVKANAVYREPIYAHNTYLDIGAETGIPNIFVWILLLSVTFVDFWKKSQQERMFFFLCLSLFIFFVHSLVETALYSPVVLTLVLILIGFSQREIKKDD